MRASKWLAGRAAGLTDAERLRLEEHVQSCARCSSDLGDLESLAALATARELPQLTGRARDRAIDNALRIALSDGVAPPVRRLTLSGGVTPRPRKSRRSFWTWLAPATALAAATAAILVFAIPGGDSATDEQAIHSITPPTAVSQTGDRVLAGDAVVDGELQNGAVVSARTRTRVALGHAVIELAPASEIYWDPDTSTVVLRKGSIVASVDKAPRKPFRVATPTFAADVLGTRFRVDLGGVQVTEGVVRIVSHDGDILAASLKAGEHWSAATAAADTSPDAGVRRTRPIKRVDVAALLANARTELARSNVADARRSVRHALRTNPTRKQRAEGETLLAECAMVDGDKADAIRLYLRVAKRHRASSAGDNALFAAARLEAQLGHTRAAREHFELYLKRYPDGHFKREASKRLDRLR